MIFRLSCAVFVLAAVGWAWQMCRVFIEPVAGRLHRSQCMFQRPRQLVERRAVEIDSFSFNETFLNPMVDGAPLEVGAVVGYELDEYTKFIHAAIYVGRGRPELQTHTVAQLHPNKHYVIEYSGPRSRSPGSQAWDIVNGNGNQNISITEMSPSVAWQLYEVDSPEYGRPFSANETVSRAMKNVGTQFGGYNFFGNNCQHFAVWVRYGKKNLMLPAQEKTQTTLRLIACLAFTSAAARAHNPLFLVGAYCAKNLWAAETGMTSQKGIHFGRNLSSYVELQKIMQHIEEMKKLVPSQKLRMEDDLRRCMKRIRQAWEA